MNHSTRRIPLAVAAVCAVVTGLLLTTNILGASASDGGSAAKSKRKGFTPKLLVGTYNGTWNNTTFGSSGSVQLVIAAPHGGKLVGTLDLGGNVFGCADPAAETLSLKAGNGQNHWNGTGFKISRTSPALGTGALTYVYKTKALTGGGADPACKPGLKWALTSTTLTKSALNGGVDITMPDGSKAVSTFTASK